MYIRAFLNRLTAQADTLQGIPVLILDGEYRADSRVTSVDRQIECTCRIGVEHIRFKRTYIAQACDKHTGYPAKQSVRTSSRTHGSDYILLLVHNLLHIEGEYHCFPSTRDASACLHSMLPLSFADPRSKYYSLAIVEISLSNLRNACVQFKKTPFSAVVS